MLFAHGDDVARAINFGGPAEQRELLSHPFGAFLFEKRGGGNAAQARVLIVDPGAFAAKPFEDGCVFR